MLNRDRGGRSATLTAVLSGPVQQCSLDTGREYECRAHLIS
jgi:hypothetical protein